MKNSNIVLFDGVCNLCNSSVNFIIDRDKKNMFRFASIQSNAGKEILNKAGIKKQDELKTIVLVKKGKTYTKSSAILNIVNDFGGFWKLLYVFIIIPPPIRDFFYNVISKNRYKWFGKTDSCRMPDANLKEKFL